MRRATILLLLLLTLSVTGAAVCAAQVYRAHDQVALLATHVCGDSAEAEGLQVSLRSSYGGHLFWDTDYRTDGQVQTAYRFSAAEDYPSGEIALEGVSLQTSYFVSVNLEAEGTHYALDAAYQALSDATPAGEEGETVIRLADYLDYYPLDIWLDLPGFSGLLDADETPDEASVSEPGSTQAALAALRDYFRIPVLETELRSIHLRKDEDGTVRGYGSGSYEGDSFCFNSISALGGSACYFTFDAHSQQDRLVDLRALPEGYGIYRLCYSDQGVDAQSLGLFYALSPEIRPLELTCSADGGQLLLHAVEDGAYVLTVIDTQTGQTLQKLTICSWPEDTSGWQLYDEGDFMAALLFYGEQIAVITRQEDGLYVLAFLCDAGTEDAPDFSLWQAAVDFDGEKLVFAGLLEDPDSGGNRCGFFLAVYDKAGLRYYGEVGSSLDTGGGADDYGYHCRPLQADPLAVHWLN